MWQPAFPSKSHSLEKKLQNGCVQCLFVSDTGVRCRHVSAKEQPFGWLCHSHQQNKSSNLTRLLDDCGDAEGNTQKALEASGFTVFRNGWPDMIATDGDAITFAVEVKRGSDFVRPNQEKVHTVLKQAGLPVIVSRSIRDCLEAVQEIQRQNGPVQMDLFKPSPVLEPVLAGAVC